MSDERFEGTLVLEQLARIDKVSEFMDAVDSEDLNAAAALMRDAGVDEPTIRIVLKKIETGDDEH